MALAAGKLPAWRRIPLVESSTTGCQQKLTLRKVVKRFWRSELLPMRTFSYIKLRSFQLLFPLSGPNIGCVQRMSTCRTLFSKLTIFVYLVGLAYSTSLMQATLLNLIGNTWILILFYTPRFAGVHFMVAQVTTGR